MIVAEWMEKIKSELEAYEPHFERLWKVASEYEALGENESGYDQELEQQILARWEKVTDKIALGLDAALEGLRVERARIHQPDAMIMHLRLTGNEESSVLLQIDYAHQGSLTLSVL